MAFGPASNLAKGSMNRASARIDSMARAAAAQADISSGKQIRDAAVHQGMFAWYLCSQLQVWVHRPSHISCGWLRMLNFSWQQRTLGRAELHLLQCKAV